MRIWALFLAATVFLAQTGCAVPAPPPPTPPRPPSEETRSRYGRIEVVKEPQPNKIKLTRPPEGSGAGAGRGAVLGLGVSLSIVLGTATATQGGREVGALVFLGAVAVAIAILPVAVLIGAIYGASAAPSAKAVEEAVERLVRAVGEADLPGQVARGILNVGRERSDESFPEQGPYETRVEVGAPEILLNGPSQINPPLQLAVLVPVRVLQGDKQLYRTTLLWRGAHPAELFEWADQEGARLRAQLMQSASVLSPAAVHQLFVSYELPRNRVWKAAR